VCAVSSIISGTYPCRDLTSVGDALHWRPVHLHIL
jgi:hypothetical protein